MEQTKDSLTHHDLSLCRVNLSLMDLNSAFLSVLWNLCWVHTDDDVTWRHTLSPKSTVPSTLSFFSFISTELINPKLSIRDYLRYARSRGPRITTTRLNKHTSWCLCFLRWSSQIRTCSCPQTKAALLRNWHQKPESAVILTNWWLTNAASTATNICPDHTFWPSLKINLQPISSITLL